MKVIELSGLRELWPSRYARIKYPSEPVTPYNTIHGGLGIVNSTSASETVDRLDTRYTCAVVQFDTYSHDYNAILTFYISGCGLD